MTTSKKGFDFARNSIYVADPMDLCIIGGAALPEGERGPIDTAHTAGQHDLYDVRITDALTEEFIANVDAFGVMTPVSIAKDAADGAPVVVAGRQRVRAARIVNLRRLARGEKPISVECKVIRRTGGGLMSAMIAENEARRDDGPMVKLEKMKALLARGVSIEDAAIAFCIKPEYAKVLLGFEDNATPAVIAAARAGRLSLTAAVEITRVKDPAKQDEVLAGALSVSGAKPATVRSVAVARSKTEGAKAPGVIPTRKETAALLKLVADFTEPAAEAAMLLALGEDEPVDVEITQGHVVDGFFLGVEAALKLVLGRDTDAAITALLAKARAAAPVGPEMAKPE